MEHPWQALAARLPGLAYEGTPGGPVLHCGQRAAPYTLQLQPLRDAPCICAQSAAVVWDDLLMTIWRPGAVPAWTQRWSHLLRTGDPEFDRRYEVLVHANYVGQAARRLGPAVRAALLKPPEIGLIVGDYGVFLYLPGVAEAAVDAYLLAAIDNVIPIMLGGPELHLRTL